MSDLAERLGQEGCDGEPYDAMQTAADYFNDLRAALGESHEAE